MGEGRTVDEAIKAALAELGASKADVNIEVVQEPAAKLFGLKREPALVRLTLKKRSKPAPHNFATVAVVNGGGLVYTAPEGRPGTPARLKFGPELKVSYNGEPVEKEVLLERGLDSLEITLPEKKEPELNYELRVNRDKTKAELVWNRTPGIDYALVTAKRQISSRCS